MAKRSRSYVFDNYGGSRQLRIESAEDLRALATLDESFWVATSAPAGQLRSDPVLLQRLDRDGDGRILSSDIRAAVEWMLSVLSRTDDVTSRSDVLHLDSIDTSTEEGRSLRIAAGHVLANLGHSNVNTLTLEAVRDRTAIVARGEQNGDGVIPLSSIAEEDLREFASDIMETTGTVDDLNGEPGVDETLLDRFLTDAAALLAWREKLSTAEASGMFPLGEGTAEGYALMDALCEPIERYFELCKVVSLNRVLGRDTLQPAAPPELYQDRALMAEYLEGAPVGRPCVETVLLYGQDVNPAYAERLRRFRDEVAAPLLGDDHNPSQLTPAEWSRIRSAFTTYHKWLRSKTGGTVERLGPERLSEYLEGGLPARLRAMINADVSSGAQLAATQKLESLILLQRWILEICNNFVSFPYLYTPAHPASFEEGRMVMDGKVFNLNIRVDDLEAHSALAERSGIFLLYSEVTRGEPQEKFHIVTPVARVEVDNLDLDKRGVLFDLEGRQWDVRVVKVVDNVVSVRRALMRPFRRFGAFTKDTLGRFGAAAEKEIQARVAQPLTGGTAPADTKASSLRDMILAGGVSVAALGSAFAYIGKSFTDPWAVLGTAELVLVIILLALVPVGIHAWFKMRARNLAGLLEASGWAINAPLRLTRAVARIICVQPVHPGNAFTLSRFDFARRISRAQKSKTAEKPQNEE